MTTAAPQAPYDTVPYVDPAGLTGEQLAVELEIARTVFRTVRLNDPRRLSLAYADAKSRVGELEREDRVRSAAAKVAAVRATPAPAPRAPRPSDHDAARAAVSARGAFAGMTMTDDEGF